MIIHRKEQLVSYSGECGTFELVEIVVRCGECDISLYVPDHQIDKCGALRQSVETIKGPSCSPHISYTHRL